MSEELNPYEAPQAELGARAEPDRGFVWLFFSFRGRATRWDYWKGAVVLMLASFFVIFPIFVPLVLMGSRSEEDPNGVAPIVVALLFLAVFWCGLAISVKRWHDRNKSGLWVLIGAVPYIGGVWTFVECGCLRGTLGPNSYGPDPLE